MVCTPLVHELLLLALLWQLVISYWTWKRSQATKHPPAQQPQRLPKILKPFAGLTKKPPCAACEHGQAHHDRPSLSPPPVLAPKRGRPRAVATQQHYCPEKTCRYYGWVGRGNIRANGHPGSGPWRQLQCVVCQTYFLETQGTPFHGKRVPAMLLVRVVTAVAEGLGIRAVARVFEVDPNTILAWLGEAADHLTTFSQYRLHDVQVRQVQLDELFALVSEGEKPQDREAEAREHVQRSPAWIWVAMDPVSKLLLAIDLGQRTLAMAQRLVHHVVQVLAPACVPLFLTDGLKAYTTALVTHFGQWVQPPCRRAKGPAPKPRWLPQPALRYAQVLKQYHRRHLACVRQRVVFDTLAGVKQVLASQGWQINTAFVERVNLTIRHHVAAVGRRILTVCKSPEGLHQQLHLYQTYYNFCLPHVSLRVPLPQFQPTKGNGTAKRWQPCTPARAAGVTDRVWSLRDVLLFRIPPWPQREGR
jgi:IS1 family transposase/transposase-like protein